MKSLKASLYKLISDRYMAGCSHYNNLAIRRACRSKSQARDVFMANDIPHAKGENFINPIKAFNFVNKHGFPVVIKPNVSGYSRGSYFPIESKSDLLKSIFLAKLWWPSTIIEQYLKGANYRVVATKDKLGSVIQRYPPFVVGDGRRTINELIDSENKIREEKKLFPIMYPIQKNNALKKHLRKQNLNLSSIPANEMYVELFYRIALAPGGVVEIIDQSSIHHDNFDLFINVVNLFNANILGIDMIFEKGIQTSYKDQKCIMIEVNSRPYLKMHNAPRYGDVEDLSLFYAELDALVVDGKDTF